MNELSKLKPAAGSTRKKNRVGRGPGSGNGKTSGKGHKGQNARSGGGVKVHFEGGQMPFAQRIPKLKGFNNPFRVEYQAVNLDTIEESGLTEITPETLYDRGLISKKALVKVLGRGEIKRAVNVRTHAISASAESAITSAGGSVEKLDLPFSIRPAAKGNALTNR